MLNREEIKKNIKEKKLIENFIDLETQAAPNGFDLTVEKIFAFTSVGKLDFSNKERIISQEKELVPKKNSGEKYGWWALKRGVYKIRTNEVVSLPKTLVALSFPRSSLLRMGGFVHTGVWDAGFKGKGEFILSIGNDKGIEIKQNARIAQIVFLKINEVKRGYDGIFNNLK